MSFFNKLKPVYDLVYKVVLFICKILLIADIAITSYAVCGRYIPFIDDPAWSEEVVLTLMSYMAVLSAALAIRRGAHIRMDAFDNFLPKKVIKFLDILADIAVSLISSLPSFAIGCAVSIVSLFYFTFGYEKAADAVKTLMPEMHRRKICVYINIPWYTMHVKFLILLRSSISEISFKK